MDQKYQQQGVRIRLHDVSPLTWDACAEWIDLCSSLRLPPPDLLVVPRHEGGPADRGAGLPKDFVKKLLKLKEQGHALWVHGWTHRADVDEAEFAGMDSVVVADRARRALLDWKDAGLPKPEGFCPPCWKMTNDAVAALFKLGFPEVDLRLGVAKPGEMKWSPVLSSWGGESAWARVWNRSLSLQRRLFKPFPVRVALHPQDLTGSARRPMENVLASLL
jgi:predicted deacetylase